MPQANDSILVTPGSGATVATHLANSKEHQVVILANEAGYIHGTAPTFIISSGNSANVAAARTTHFDLFNATGSGKIIEVVGIYIIPTLAAVTGVGLTWEIIKTTAVGTGGSTLTPRKADSTDSNLNANITARSKPTGGATTDFIWLYPNTSSEETIPYASLASILNHVSFGFHMDTKALILNENEGLKIDQTTNSSVGSTNILVVFTTN
jgi:hypothetical protein